MAHTQCKKKKKKNNKQTNNVWPDIEQACTF